MHELPSEADEVLVLARRAQQEPDAAVRDRVRRGVTSALLVGAAVGATTTVAARVGASSAWTGALTAKVLAGAAVCAVALGVAVAPRLAQTPRKAPPAAAHTGVSSPARHERAPLHASQAVVDAPTEAAPATTGDTGAEPGALAPSVPTPAPGERAPVSASRELAPRPATAAAPSHRAPTSQAPLSLRAELALLEQAERALEQNDPARALQVLARHRASFAQSSFVDEREGLSLIARCTLESSLARAKTGPVDGSAAADEARAFLARARTSVLHERVLAACRGAQ